MSKLLIIEDDRDYGKFLQERLMFLGHDVDLVHSAVQGLEYLSINNYDMLISDLHLDVMNGIHIATTAKKMKKNIKTIILTAKPSDDSELESLTLNVDQYLEKEKSIKVILMHITQLLERDTNKDHERILTSDTEKIVMNLRNYEVRKDDKTVNLTPIEFTLLAYFLENKNTVLTREQIFQRVWRTEEELKDDRRIDVHIRKLRSKMDIFSIFSVRGVGYKWIE